MKLRGWLSLLLLTWCAYAAAEPVKTLAGRWSASTARTSWSVEQWGDACGPRPHGESVPGGIVTIAVRGSELVIDGLGRSYSTATCWENIPGQRVTSHASSARAWRTVCQSAANDPRRATVTTTLTATDDKIEFAEIGQYEFAIEQQNCRATMRRSRSYSLVEREGESRVASPASEPNRANSEDRTSADPKGEVRTAPSCSDPGPPARLEVRPTRKLLRAGDEYSFRARVLDRAGCPLDRPVTWKLTNSNTNVELAPNGILRVAKDAAEGTATMTAAIQERSVQVTVDVVSEGRYQELLRAGSFDDHGETRDTAIATIASSTVGTKTAILEENARTRRLVFVAIVGVIALGLGVAALWMALGRRRQKGPSETEIEGGGSVENGTPNEAPAVVGGSATTRTHRDWLICPTCGEEYPLGTKYCATDGNRLVTASKLEPLVSAQGGVCPVCGQGFDPGISVCPVHDEELIPPMALAARRPEPPPAPKRICPVCGTIYETEHQFCGNDGAALVPIN